VSENKESDRLRLRREPEQNPPNQQPPEVAVDDSGVLPTYSNFCRVTATPEEVLLDFGLNMQPFAEGRQDVKANQRIVMTMYTTKRLLTALGMTIQRHEQTFGVIELDVRRRVSAPQPQMAQSGAPGALGVQSAIKLDR
jgi:Protein of unknown function (DUF3467)